MESIPILWEVLKCAAVPICKRINYARNLSSNTRALKEEADSLHAKRDDLLNKIERLKFEKTPTEHGKKWLQDVEQIEQQLREMEEEYQAATTKGCGTRWCCNVYSRRKLGESVQVLKSKIQTLNADNVDEHFLDDLPPPRVPMVPNLSVKAETVVDATLEELFNYLEDKNIQRIGIWGKGGIGKTTLMKALNNMPEVRGMFDWIIWVTVSNSWDIKKLQKEIADRLSVNVLDKSEDNVAIILLEKLKGQKYLLLLDDVWEMVNLVKLGVPNTSEDNGCKVVLTTREMQVCCEMETDKEIELLPWPEKEAWDMFCSKAGGVAMTPEIKGLAEGVVKECAGLPLALSVVGGMLRREEDVYIWRDILRELKSPTTSYNKGMNEKVYDILQTSYDYIKEEEVKDCFLFCGLYREDEMIKKSKLIKYWHAEGLLLADGTLMDSYNRGHRVIRDLVNKSLLERCENERYVKLHDLVRDMVLRITSPSHGKQSKHLVINWSSNPRVPCIEEWESAKRISFVGIQSEDLPMNPNCSILSTLIIYTKYKSVTIPEEFFVHMSVLRVLNLSGSSITHLPPSVVNLINLRSLLLRNCRYLKTLPKEVSAMKKLEVLCATDTDMLFLPLEIFELTSLKFLKLTSLNCFSHLRPWISGGGGVKWGLKLLEVFVINRHLSDSLSDADMTEIAKELGMGMLRGLRSLKFDFRTLENFKEFVQGISKPWRSSSSRDQMLTKFEIRINCYDLRFDYRRKWKKCLAYVAGEEQEGSNSSNNNMSMLPVCIGEVLACCDSFQLLNHGGVKFLSTLFSSVENFGRGLKFCSVSECRAMEKIIENQTLNDDDGVFSNLEVLNLRSLGNLRSIWEPPKPQHSNNKFNSSFYSLRELHLLECLRLKKLFSWRFVRHLPNLTELHVASCFELKELISEDKDEEEEEEEEEERVDSETAAAAAAAAQVKEAAAVAPLPKLRRLSLSMLPEFERICSSNTNTKEASSSLWPSLEELSVCACSELRRLPFNSNDDAPNLKKITGEYLWWITLKWDDHDYTAANKSRLQSLFTSVADPFSMF